MASTIESVRAERGALSALVHRLEERKVIAEIEAAVAIDADFPESLCYELLGKIRGYLITIQYSDFIFDRQDSWLLAIEKLHSKLGDKNKKIRKTAITKLLQEGKSKREAEELLEKPVPDFDPFRYPIAAFLMENKVLSEEEEQEYLDSYMHPDHTALQSLFFTALVNSPGSVDFNYLAIVLRGSLIGPSLGYSEFIKNMAPLGDFFERLNIENFISTYSGDERYRKSSFFQAIIKLAELVKPHSADTKKVLPSVASTPPPSLADPEDHNEPASSPLPGTTSDVSTTTDWPESDDPYATVASLTPPELPSEEAANDQARTTRRWEGRYHRSTSNDYTRLTPIERRQVVQVLTKCLQSPDKHEADGAAAVFLMYATGKKLNEVLVSRVGKKGDFSRDGTYQRALKLPNEAYEPAPEKARHLEIYQNHIELQLPAMILPWMNERLDLRCETILQCMVGDEQCVRKNVELVLDKMRDSGRFQRVRAERISAALLLELSIKYQDPTVMFFLAGKPMHEAPMLSYYVVHNVEELARRYLQTVHDLFDLPISSSSSTRDSVTFSGYFPTTETIHFFREGVSEKFRASIANSEDIVTRHNAFTSYCLGMLLLCTGHRPSRDPFSSIDHFNLEKGLALICDKASDQARAWRMVALPQMAASQLKVYLDYLPKLAAHLQQLYPSNILSQRILRMSNGQADMLPLFFMLSTRGGLKHASVSEAKLAEQWSAFWPLPVNFLRHVMATRLLQLTNRADYVQLQLGHMNGMDYPVGKKSTEPVLKTLSDIACNLDRMLRELGWEVMGHKMRLPVSGPARFEREKPDPILLGPALRLARAKERETEAVDLIKRLVASQCRGKVKIRQEDFEELLQLADSEALELGFSVKLCRRILHRYIRTQRGGKEFLRQRSLIHADPEPSPFKADTLTSYQSLINLRVEFANHLDRRGRDRSVPTEEQRLVEIVCSAALFGGIADTSRLKLLGNALQASTYRYSGLLFVDIPMGAGEHSDSVSRWYPDKISSILIEGYYKVRKSECVPVTVSERSMQKILALIGSTGEEPLKSLAQKSKVGLVIEAPGYVAAAANGENHAVSLKLPALVRVVSGQALAGNTKDSMANESRVDWLPDLAGSATTWSKSQSKSFLHQLQKLIKSAKTATRDAGKGVNRQQKNALVKSLKKATLEPWMWPVLPRLLAGWAVRLCQHGSSYKANLAYSTIEKYLMLVANRLCPLAEELGDFTTMDAEAFEQLYLRVVESEPKSGRFEVARQLFAFHSFIADSLWLDELDWSVIMAAAGGKAPVQYADANYITSTEYQHALQVTLQEESLPEINRWQYAGLLIWGYRAGLRFGEAFRLQYRDIQREGNEFYLWIRDTLHGQVKTNSSKRVACLVEQLSTTETLVIGKLLSSAKSDFDEDGLIALTRSSAGSRELLSRSTAVQYLGQLLKAVTGTEDARYHHLRHGWVTRQVGALAGVGVPGFSDEILDSRGWLKSTSEAGIGYPLRSIAVGVGHASEMTTLGSYTHCADLIATKYYPDLCPISDFAVAYAEQVSPDTPRRRKARGKSSGWRAPIPTPDVQTSKHPRVLSRQELWKPTSIKLPELDRLLQRFSVSDQPIEAIAIHLQMSIATAEMIVKRATRVETLSGYRGYRLAEKSKDPVAIATIGKPGTEKLYKNESVRLHLILKKLETFLEEMPSKEQREFFAGVGTWLDSTSSDPTVSIVADVEGLNALVNMAGKLGVSAAILVEPTYNVKLLEYLKVPVTVTQKLPTKRAGGLAGCIGVKLLSSPDIGSHRSLRRLLFVLATGGEYLLMAN